MFIHNTSNKFASKNKSAVFKQTMCTTHMYRTDMAFNEFTGDSDRTQTQCDLLQKTPYMSESILISPSKKCIQSKMKLLHFTDL
jgi:hypothetical protein